MQIVGTCLNCLPDCGCLVVNVSVAAAFLSLAFIRHCSRRAWERDGQHDNKLAT